jgi:hypothetical protein
MSVSNRIWSASEVRVSDAVAEYADRQGVSTSEIVGIGAAYLNHPAAWSAAGEEGPIVQCSFMTRSGMQRRIRLGVATYGSLATVYHYETDVREGELIEPFVAIDQEFAADEEEFDYVPRRARTDRSIRVAFSRRGRRLPLQHHEED